MNSEKWEMVKLGDVASYINGYAFKPSDRTDNGLSIIRIQDLTGNAYETNYFNGTYNTRYEINNGDILISWSASLGVYEWKREKALLNQHIFKVVFDKLAIDKAFFSYAVKERLNSVDNQTHGSTMKHITKTRFDNLEIPLPPLEIQKQIADEFDRITGLIEKRKEQLEKLDLLVKSRFIEMFGDPVVNPMGWDKVVLEKCIETIDNGRSFVCSGNARTDENPAILKLSAVTSGVYKPKENKEIINVEDFIEGAEVHAKDLLFTRKNTPELVGMAAYVNSTPKKLMMPDLIFRLNMKDTCNKIFLWQLINHDLFRRKIQSLANGSAKSMSNISKERLGKMMIYLPPRHLQTQFADFVQQVDKSKFEIKQSLEKLETLKKALMQEHFG